MSALATGPVERRDVRLVVIDPELDGEAAVAITGFAALPDLLAAGDTVVVNDAATLPASLRGVTARGEPVELRLIPPLTGPHVAAVLLGAGDHHTPTEHRPPPPPLAPGDVLALGGGLTARLEAVAGRQASRRRAFNDDSRGAGSRGGPRGLPGSNIELSSASMRHVSLVLDRDGDALWQAIYDAGRPVQYAHRAAPLPLWAVQTVYASRPWSAEMPSAGRPLTWDILLGLRRRGVTVASLTHGAGLSATGDPVLDAALPLPEPYDLPAATVRAVEHTRRAGGRVIAVGTTVMRALEEAAARPGGLAAGTGLASLVITPAHRPRVVDGILSGLHGPEESHFRLLGSLVPRPTLDLALARAAAAGLHGHELGDACLIRSGSGAPAPR